MFRCRNQTILVSIFAFSNNYEFFPTSSSIFHGQQFFQGMHSCSSYCLCNSDLFLVQFFILLIFRYFEYFRMYWYYLTNSLSRFVLMSLDLRQINTTPNASPQVEKFAQPFVILLKSLDKQNWKYILGKNQTGKQFK